MHDDELDISAELVERLLRRDAPQLADLPLRRLAASGSTNVLFRLGDDHLVRLPRQPGGGASIEAEARWLALLAPSLPVRVPEVVVVGRPDCGYPETWAITTWIDGECPSTPEPAADDLARDLATFVSALRAVPVPADALADPALRWYRSAPLADIDDDIREYLRRCRDLPDLQLDLDACERLWSEAVALPAGTEKHWVHGDLLAENLLVRDGRLAAVLDFGALSIGDPSVDLIVAWAVLGPDAREVFRQAVGVDDLTWRRGRGWALAIALMTFPYYWHSLPGRCRANLAMACEVLADAESGG